MKEIKRDSRKGNADEITGKGSKMSIAVQVQLTLISRASAAVSQNCTS